MKALSMNAVYGLRALMYIAAQREQEGYVSIRKISEDLDISFHFLTKILQTLTQHHVLHSQRGPAGGVALAKAPEQVTLLEILYILEGERYFSECFLGLPGCGEQQPCPVHDFWRHITLTMKEKFSHTTLAELSDKVRSGEVRLVSCM